MKKLSGIIVFAALLAIPTGGSHNYLIASHPQSACTVEVGTITGQLLIDHYSHRVLYLGSTEAYTLEHVGSC